MTTSIYTEVYNEISEKYLTKNNTLNSRVKYKYELILHNATKFLHNTNASNRFRWYCIKNNIIEIPKCKECGKYVHVAENTKEFHTYCSNKCSQLSKETQDKIKETNLKKYGVDYGITSDFIKNKIKETNLKKYGVSYNSQIHINKKTLNLLNDKHWLIENHHIKKYSLSHIAKMLNVMDTTVSRYMNKFNIQCKLFSVSSQERKIYNELSQYNIKIIQNDRSILKPLELDFYFPDHDLAIEVNGLYWHNEDHKDKMYHENKRLKCEEKGITLLQFWDYEINDNFDLIISMILNYLKLNTNKRIFARKCKIIQITDKLFINNFLDKNHIQGSVSTTICYGLEYEDKIVSIMGFNKSNLKQYDYSLVRFCSLKNYSVIGGASKLLKQMKNYKLVSYSDGRYSNGGLYKTLGFELIKINKPDYKYTLKFKNLHHKFGFRRKSIKIKYPEYYSDDLTEKEMMNRIGYKRVYGCSIKTWKLLNV